MKEFPEEISWESVVGVPGGSDGGDKVLWGILTDQNLSMSH